MGEGSTIGTLCRSLRPVDCEQSVIIPLIRTRHFAKAETHAG
jgi:hypothetical protein